MLLKFFYMWFNRGFQALVTAVMETYPADMDYVVGKS